MFQESKDDLALILYGSDESHNDLADEFNYQHVNVVFPLASANWRLFEEIQKIRSGHQPADSKTKTIKVNRPMNEQVQFEFLVIDAIVVAADHLRRETE
jgi:hypothetical protein